MGGQKRHDLARTRMSARTRGRSPRHCQQSAIPMTAQAGVEDPRRLRPTLQLDFQWALERYRNEPCQIFGSSLRFFVTQPAPPEYPKAQEPAISLRARKPLQGRRGLRRLPQRSFSCLQERRHHCEASLPRRSGWDSTPTEVPQMPNSQPMHQCRVRVGVVPAVPSCPYELPRTPQYSQDGRGRVLQPGRALPRL